MKQGTFVFDDIRNLLDRQFNRLSELETEVMYWLVIKREPVSFPELQAAFANKVRQSQILEALASLHRRSLIEKTSSTLVEKNSVGFTQQLVVMEYLTEQLIEQVGEEITTQKLLFSKDMPYSKLKTKTVNIL